jgi:hypothetical protein
MPRPDPSYGVPPAMQEYLDKSHATQAYYFGGRRYWYLDMMGRNPERTEPRAPFFYSQLTCHIPGEKKISREL